MPVRRVLEHGQITIPKPIRQILGLKKGDMAEVELEGDTIVITPKKLVKSHGTPQPQQELPERLTNPRYGEKALEAALHKRADNAVSLEEVRKITANLPSLSRLIAEDRDADRAASLRQQHRAVSVGDAKDGTPA